MYIEGQLYLKMHNLTKKRITTKDASYSTLDQIS